MQWENNGPVEQVKIVREYRTTTARQQASTQHQGGNTKARRQAHISTSSATIPVHPQIFAPPCCLGWLKMAAEQRRPQRSSE